MLFWKLMKATERARRNVCEGEEAAFHYNETLSRFDRLTLWTGGLIAGWLQETECRPLPAHFRLRSRWRRR